VWFVVAIVIALLTGCATSPPSVAAHPHRLILATSRPRAMAGMGFSGRVRYDAAGCVVLGSDLVLLAPAGSRLEGDRVVLRDVGVRRLVVRVGQTTALLGGVEVGTASEYVPVGTRCSSRRYLLLE